MSSLFKTHKKALLISGGILMAALVLSGAMILYLHQRSVAQKAAILEQNNGAILTTSAQVEYGDSLEEATLLALYLDSAKLYERTDASLAAPFITEGAASFPYTFHEVGDFPLTLRLAQEKITLESTLTLTVVDTQPPVLEGVTDQSLEEGGSFDPKSGITAKDPVDGEVEVQVIGTVDMSTPGEYTLTAKATDRNGLSAEANFQVTVTKKPVATPPPPTKPIGGSSSSTSGDTRATRLAEAKAEAKRVVSQIISPSMSDYDKAYAICYYLNHNVALQTDQSTEAYKVNHGDEAYAALLLKKAACSGFCHAVTLMCQEAGLTSKHMNEDLWTHQWNMVLVDGRWIVLDAQGGFFGMETHPLESGNFPVIIG